MLSESTAALEPYSARIYDFPLSYFVCEITFLGLFALEKVFLHQLARIPNDVFQKKTPVTLEPKKSETFIQSATSVELVPENFSSNPDECIHIDIADSPTIE